MSIIINNRHLSINPLYRSRNQKKHIILPPLSWGGIISPFLFLENQISFSDVDEVLGLEAETMAARINDDTKAVISVDYGGVVADSQKIKK